MAPALRMTRSIKEKLKIFWRVRVSVTVFLVLVFGLLVIFNILCSVATLPMEYLGPIIFWDVEF
jgi:hypothetical protein